jgi:hypothetical protein
MSGQNNGRLQGRMRARRVHVRVLALLFVLAPAAADTHVPHQQKGPFAPVSPPPQKGAPGVVGASIICAPRTLSAVRGAPREEGVELGDAPPLGDHHKWPTDAPGHPGASDFGARKSDMASNLRGG